MEIVCVLIGAVIGGIIAWLMAKMAVQKAEVAHVASLHAEFAGQRAEIEGRAKYHEARAEELRILANRTEGEIEKLRSQLENEQQSRIEAATRLEESQKNLEDQKILLGNMRREMTDTFNALSAAALKSSSEEFIRLASENIGKVLESTKGRLGEHQAAMGSMIQPLRDTLKKYEEQMRQMEDNRLKTFGSLEEQLRILSATHENLQKETSNLVTALRKPHVRGRWGEMQLRRVAELSGMSMHCDFTEQQTIETEKGKVRPDMIVHLPLDRDIIVDSKVSLDAYLDAISAQTEEEKKTKMERHAQQVRVHMKALSSKEYWNQFEKSPEFVVLFMPGESFLSAALDMDATLIEEGIRNKVIIATPTTFIALLRAIGYGWQQERVTRNALEISLLGKELYERISKMLTHFEDIGGALKKGIEAYNRAVRSLESRVLPSVRRFRDLGVSSSGDIQPLEQIDRTPRAPEALPADDK
jgi:DNA recombination protein RmuC